MKPLLAGLLSVCLLLNSVSPAFAQLVKAGEGAKAVAEIIAKAPAKQTIKEMVLFARRLPTSPILTQDVAYIAVVEQWALANYGAEAASRFSIPEKVQLLEQNAAHAVLPKQEVTELLSNPTKIADITQLNNVQKEYFYVAAFPEQVIEGGVIPSKGMLESALAYNRNLALQGIDGSLDSWARQMGAITNLGLFGTAQDARLIVDSAKQVTGAEKGVTDVIAVRALVNILGADAYKYVKELVAFRLQATDSLGNPAQLSYAWVELSTYMEANGLPLDIPLERISSIPVMGLTKDAEKLLGKYNAYNLYNKEAAVQLTEKFKELRGHVQETLGKQEILSQIAQKISTPRMPVRPVQKIQPPAQSFANVKQGTAPMTIATAPCSNLYCGLFPFIPKRQSVAKAAEEPGLHDNNVTIVYETFSVPQEAGEVPAVEKAIVPVEEQGFKLTLETDSEKILHNVNVIMSPSFKTSGYNRLTISDKDIFQLRDTKLKPENLNRFFIELLNPTSGELSNAQGTLWHLLRGKPGEELSRPLRIKLQRIKAKRQTAVNLEVGLEGGQGVPTIAQVDRKLLPKKATPTLGKIMVKKSGKIYYEQYGKSPALLHNYSVRLPKGDSKLWARMMQSQPNVPFTIKVRPTQNKMPLLAELLPMNMLGMGKTISPELAARSSFDASTSSSIMFSINNFTPALIGFLRPVVDKYGESTVLRIGSLFFLFGGVSALATGLYGHLGSGVMTPLQLAGFLTSTASIAIGTNIVRFAQNLAIGANVGVVSDRKKQAEEGPELSQGAYTWKHLAERFKEVFATRQTQPGGAVVWYQVAQMFKNLGTLAFLGLPWVVNTVAQKAFGVELGLDFSMSYVPYTALAAWTAWRLSTTAIKDTIPTQLGALERQFNDTMARATGPLVHKWAAGIIPEEKDIAKAVDDINTSLDLLLKAKQRQKIKFDEKEFVRDMKQKSADHLFEQLVQKGVSQEQAAHAQKVLQKTFAAMDPHAVTMGTVWKMEGIAAGAIAATLATMHELSVSNGFAFALRNLMPSGDAANALTAFALYGSMSLGRLVGNWLSKRMSGSSLYTFASTCSAVGTGVMIGAGESVPMLIAGAVVASFGVGNFFTQMYDFMTKSAQKKYRRAISLILNYTMPAAAVLSMPMRKLVEVTGIPALDLSISGVALLASFAFSYRMFAKSSLIRTLQNEGGKAVNKIKNLFRRNQPPHTPTNLDNAAPAQ